MTKGQFIAKWEWHSKILIADFEAVIAHEIEKVQENKPQPAKPFDKERFEAMFRAVLASWEFENITEAIEQTEYNLNKLDAYYATKEGGSNG